MLENLSNHSTPRAREVYLRRICRDLDIRETVLTYEHYEEEPDEEETDTPQIPTYLKKSQGSMPRPRLKRHQSIPKLEPLRKELGDYDKSKGDWLYHPNTDVPEFVEDWTQEPPSKDVADKEKLWQAKFHKQAQPLLKLSAFLNMPLEQSSVLFVHYDIDDEIKKHLATFAGAAMAIPMDGRKVPEPGSLTMVWKALKGLDRAGRKKATASGKLPEKNAWA